MIEPEEIQIKCVGYSIAADWYQGVGGEAMLVLHGFQSSKASQVALTQVIVEKTGTSALAIDITGHGNSPYKLEELTPAQNFLEVVMAFDWIRDKYPKKKINVMGTSYGGFLATQLTKYRKFNKLVLRVPALYRPEAFYSNLAYYATEEGKNDSFKYRNDPSNYQDHPLLRRAASFKGKTLVITHELDDRCPTPNTDAYIKAFGAEAWEAKGFKHGIGETDFTEEQILEYQNKIADWLRDN